MHHNQALAFKELSSIVAAQKREPMQVEAQGLVQLDYSKQPSSVGLMREPI